jgi:spore coat polysaccharide biosynthesis protein SpsF
MNGISCFRGSELDLLDRYYRAAEKYNAKIIARLTGDDPLTDPDLIDRMIIELNTEGYDVVTNSITPTYPEGLDVTIMRSNVLFDAWSNAILPSHREHVTPYTFGASSKYKIFNYVQDIDYSAFRWTVDHQTDFDFVEEVYKQLYLKKSDFSTEDIYKFLDLNPSLANTNSMYERNEGYLKSLKLDPKVR